MKRMLTMVFLLSALLFSLSVKADGIKNNDLNFETKRIEQEENDTIGDVSDITADLFQTGSQELYDANKEQAVQANQQVLGSLFTNQNTQAEPIDISQIFLEAAQTGNYHKRTMEDTDAQVGFSINSLTLLLVYSAFIFLMIFLAGISSYRVSREDEDGLTY